MVNEALVQRWLGRVVVLRPGEGRALAWSFTYFFCLLAGYYVLRPLRDEMGIAGGVRNLQWLFTATFVTMLAAVPVFGAMVARLPRRRFIPLVYHFFVANIAIFWLLLTFDVGKVQVARVFFVWISVFNLFAVSVFWSFMADLFSSEQGKRLFGFIAAGGSAGALAGPAITVWLAVPLGPVNLLVVAAVLLEPIQGEAGVIIPPPDYLREVRALCDRVGALLILDEVQTGIGRCGTLFACEQFGVVPDILCTAKSLGGGVLPIGAFTARPDVWAPFDENPLIHTSTFGGNPAACVAALAALAVIEEEGLLERARARGGRLLRGLRESAGEYPEVISEVRGRGLLIGLDLATEGVGGMFISELFAAGVIVVHSLNNHKVIRVMPPAVITEGQCDRVLEAVAGAARAASAVGGEL